MKVSPDLSPLIGEISMDGAGSPGARMRKGGNSLIYQADAQTKTRKLFLIFFPMAQRNFAGKDRWLFVGGNKEECLPTFSVICQAEGIAFDAEEVTQVCSEDFPAFLVPPVGFVAAPIQHAVLVGESLQ